MVAQLLVTEGFAAIEDIAYVDENELASIEGFDEDTAVELQTRAREALEREAAELDARRRELGVDDAVLDVEGVTLPMSVALGEAGVKTLEDLADLATDELRGAFESKGGERVRNPGALENFNLAVEDAEAIILRARVAAGWIDPADLAQPEADDEAPEADAEDLGDEPNGHRPRLTVRRRPRRRRPPRTAALAPIGKPRGSDATWCLVPSCRRPG